MQEQQPSQARGAYRAGPVIEVTAIRYPGGIVTHIEMFNPSPREVIDAIVASSGHFLDQLAVVGLTVDAEIDGKRAKRVVAVELREVVDIGQGALVGVVQGGHPLRTMAETLQDMKRKA